MPRRRIIRSGMARTWLMITGRATGVPGPRISGRIVRVNILTLEPHKDRHPLVASGEMKNEAPVLVHSVVLFETPAVSLIHVEIVHSIPRHKPEDLVHFALRTPSLTKGIDDRVLIRHRALHVTVELLV